MAMVTCPECGKEISDSASFCPHCGYLLALSKSSRSTELSEPKKNNALGIAYVVCGVAAVIFGIFTLAIIIGFFAIIGGGVFISLGIDQLKGVQSGSCPYCGNSASVRVRAKTYKCPHCNKISTKKEMSLEAIE